MILLFVMPEFTNLSIYHHAIHQSLTCMPIPARVEPSSTMMISMPIPIKEDKARRLETQASRYGAALYTGMITESVINTFQLKIQGTVITTLFLPQPIMFKHHLCLLEKTLLLIKNHIMR